MKKQIHTYGNRKVAVWYRPGKREPSSDQQAIAEVLVSCCYRNKRAGFDVLPGEKWLDLGANIGAFAVYAHLRGASEITCFEPDPENFKILELNAPFANLNHAAVTMQSAPYIDFARSPNPQNNYRGTEMPPPRYVATAPVRNVYAGFLVGQKFDGVKCDIEGSEGPIIDNWMLPKCNKLVLEYHSSRDSSGARLAQRINALRRHFDVVKYPAVFQRVVDLYARSGLEQPAKVAGWPPRMDQLIFCWNHK